MRLFAFWALRGYTPAQLVALTPIEKAFLGASRDLFYEELEEMFGGGK